MTVARAKARFSERVEAVGDDEDAGGGQERQDDPAEPVLAPVQPLVGQQPRAVVLDHAADRAEPRPVRRADLADAGLDAGPEAQAAVLRAVPPVRRSLSSGGLRPTGGPAGGRAPPASAYGRPIAAQTTRAGRSRCGKRRVSCTFAAEGTTPGGRPSVEATTWYLVPALPRSVGFGPASSPPRSARTEQLSTATSRGVASGPERTSRSRATWTRRSSAVAPHPSGRRRGVEPEARPAAAPATARPRGRRSGASPRPRWSARAVDPGRAAGPRAGR
jgi:hypothetical protein